jgi:hypothetical protein
VGAEITAMYQAAGLQLVDFVQRRFEEVAQFHNSIVQNVHITFVRNSLELNRACATAKKKSKPRLPSEAICSGCCAQGERSRSSLYYRRSWRRSRSAWKGAVTLGEGRGLRHADGMVFRRVQSSKMDRAAFAGFRFPPDVITLAVRWYLRYGLSYRDVEEPLVP